MNISAAFIESFFTKSGILGKCGSCGKVHFATGQDPADFKEDWPDATELAQLREGVLVERTVEHKDEAYLTMGHFAGCDYVFGCCPDEHERLEGFAWGNRANIANYLDIRADNAIREASDDATISERVAIATENTEGQE